jgi:hypothetical protein
MRQISRFLFLITLVLCARSTFAVSNGKIIYNFNGSVGSHPEGPVAIDASGNLFGIAGESTVYELSPAGGIWTASVVYDLPQTGYYLSMDAAGDIYGTLIIDGPKQCGSIFQLSPNGHGGWTEKNLHTLNPVEGCNPYAVVFDPVSGNVYGAAPAQGNSGYGTVFELIPSQGTWTFNVIYYFQGRADGSSPNWILTVDSSGNLYGTAQKAGIYGEGTVFKLTRGSSGTWNESTIYDFTGGYNGAQPSSGVVFDQQGNLYGTTAAGADNVGNVYELTPTKGYWVSHVIHTFTGGRDGASPTPFSLAIDRSGNLFGATAAGGIYNQGVAYEISPTTDGKWMTTPLHDFTGGVDGANPFCGLVFDLLGNLYGTADAGGAYGDGEVFMGTP